jgi:ArsR family transcriptional regulator
MDTLHYFKALADATRIKLINILRHHELSVNEIVALMGMGQSRISRHLKILTDAGFLSCRRDGVWAFYSVSRNGPARKFIDSIQYSFDQDMALAQDLVDASRLIQERGEKTIQFFDTIAHDWDHLKQEILGEFELNKAILKEIPPSTTLADLGCGTGELLFQAQTVTGKTIGVDSSPQMLAQARKRFSGVSRPPDLRLGEVEHLPLSDEEADCAIISMVLHHISRPDDALAEVHRILGPGGTLIIAELDKHSNEDLRNSYGDRWLGFHRHEMNQLLVNAGFIIKNTLSFELKQALLLNIYKSEKTNEGG